MRPGEVVAAVERNDVVVGLPPSVDAEEVATAAVLDPPVVDGRVSAAASVQRSGSGVGTRKKRATAATLAPLMLMRERHLVARGHVCKQTVRFDAREACAHQLPAAGHGRAGACLRAILEARLREVAVFNDTAVWVPGTLRTSCDLLIFVDQAAESVASSDVVDLGCGAVGKWS
jgi:hypothetical protein